MPKNRKRNPLFDNYLNLAIVSSCIFLTIKLYHLLTVGAWTNREEFFLAGAYSPNLLDMLINELLLSCLLISVIIGNFRFSHVIFVALCAIVYFTRAGIILFLIAILASPHFSFKKKIAALFISSTGSLLIILIRFDFNTPLLEDLTLFYLKYPLVGIGRLLVAGETNYESAAGLVALFFRPLGILTFTIDYLLSLNGSLSFERNAGYNLSEFIFVPLLDGSFNAFGTILFPYVLSLGWVWGLVVFLLTIPIYFYILRIFLGGKSAFRILAFLMATGLLFSWNSPFIWIAPFCCKVLLNRKGLTFS